MTSIDELKSYLRRVLSGQARVEPPVVAPTFDLARAHRHLLEALERARRGRDEALISELIERWHGEALRVALTVAEAELRRGLCANADRETVQTYLHRLIDVMLGLHASGRDGSVYELRRIVRRAFYGLPSGYVTVDRCALELRLTCEHEAHTELTPLGRVVLDLPHGDAVRWVLAIENCEASSETDPWHASRALLERILASARIDAHAVHHAPLWGESMLVRHRLEELGVLDFHRDDDSDTWTYGLNPSLRALVEDVVSPAPSPVVRLAYALHAQERGRVGGHALAAEVEAAALREHGRLAQTLSDELYRALDGLHAAQLALDEVLRDGTSARTQQARDTIAQLSARMSSLASTTEALVGAFDERAPSVPARANQRADGDSAREK